MRVLGLRATSAGAIRTVRGHATRLGLDVSHFRGKRRWSDVIDYFFIVDGDLTMHLIPSRVVAGRVGRTLRACEKYVVGNAGGLLGVGIDAAAVGVVSESA
jgi:hypothetical protein